MPRSGCSQRRRAVSPASSTSTVSASSISPADLKQFTSPPEFGPSSAKRPKRVSTPQGRPIEGKYLPFIDINRLSPKEMPEGEVQVRINRFFVSSSFIMNVNDLIRSRLRKPQKAR